MGVKTTIEYCDSSVNPVPFCTGCELYDEVPHCYAARLCNKYAGRPGWPESFTTPTYFPERLDQACKWSDLTGTPREDKPWLSGAPRVIFVNDIGDGFNPKAVPERWLPLDRVLRMAKAPHIWLFLTKWPHNMFDYFDFLHFVPPNFWLGTSITRQDNVWRSRHMVGLRCLTENIWYSLEPMLEPISLTVPSTGGFTAFWPPNWIAAGGESGPQPRPLPYRPVLQIARMCEAVGKPFFFKQWGDAPGNTEMGWNSEKKRGGMVLGLRQRTQVPFSK